MKADPLIGAASFAEAAERWLAIRKPYIKARTHSDYREYIKALLGFFGELSLGEIHIGHLREYQMSRHAGASRINHELNTLTQILRSAGLWAPLQDSYEPLPLPRWIPPRVMTPEDKERLFYIAGQNVNWTVAYWASVLQVSTAIAPGELRGLRLQNVDLADLVIYVPDDTVKNEYRARLVPLNSDAYQATKELLKLAREKGCYRPEHYLLPFRVKKGTYDPTRPCKGWRTAFRGMSSAANVPWLRPYDLRHQPITEMLEDPHNSEEGIKSVVGQVSDRILNVYSHIRLHKKREIVNRLSIRKPPQAVQGSGKARLERFRS